MVRWLLAMALVWTAPAGPAVTHEHAVGEVTIEHPHARATVAVQKNGAVYMVIRNRGHEPERLLAVRTGEAKSAELHGSTITAEGIAQMRPADTLEIPPGSEATFAPGGLHIMLVGLKGPLIEGTSFPLTLVFERAGEVDIEIMVDGSGAGTRRSDHGADHQAGHKPQGSH